ncbi:sodium-dependent transporter [Spiroplasma endosymbiont of Polydrusus pterygomalis]|uniref:sodium-dependent transporter n=1 Tax=Spiroplasma endosymbiont of Polydrusus pterygomalis TaxID=3139327 RepID=UPI003CCB374C
MSIKKQMTKFGFIVSSLGAAIGLGVIWGLPGYINKNGGFYFFLIYILAMLIVGVPLLIFEFNLGNLRRKSVINIFDKESVHFSRFMGWFQATLMIIIPIYYSVLVGYTIISIGIEFSPTLISNVDGNIFNNHILEQGGFGVINNGGFQWLVFLAFLFVVLLVGVILLFGIKGIEKVNKFFMPLLFLIILILAIYILTVSGSHQGLATLFLPENLKKLQQSETWSSVFSLSFFTTSLGMGMMMRFSGVGPHNQDNASKAYLLVIGILFLSITNLIFIFGASGAIVNNLVTDKSNILLFQQQIAAKFGNDLMVFVFNVLPETFHIINQNTAVGIGNFLGVLFFLALFIAGLSTTVGNVEVVVDAIETQYEISNQKVICGICSTIILVGLALVFESTYQVINSFQLLAAGLDLILVSLAQIIFFVWYARKINIIINYNNQVSWIKLRKLYQLMMHYLIPLILGVIIGFSIYDFIISCTKNVWYISVLAFVLGIFVPVLVASLNNYYGIKREKGGVK